MKTITDYLNELTTDLDLSYCYDEGDDFKTFSEKVETYIRENYDIIYYSRAIEFLSEHDPSLQESLSIASDLGFDASNLNSEVLASLLNEQFMMNQWYELEADIIDYFDEYEEYLTDLEDEEE